MSKKDKEIKRLKEQRNAWRVSCNHRILALNLSAEERRDLAKQLEAATAQRDEALQECARLADVVMTLRFQAETQKKVVFEFNQEIKDSISACDEYLAGLQWTPASEFSRAVVNGGVCASKDGPQ